MLFASMPDNVINFLLKMFALPPTIKVANVGDFYSVDFRDWIQQSPLAEKRLMGGATTGLHTNWLGIETVSHQG